MYVMGHALYRKYRPHSLDEVIGQEHITKTLDNAIKQGKVAHAYLFTGPRGVGKTSVARILAHTVNGIKYDSDKLNIDIIEIDAASNRGIDEIRDLKEKVYIAPTSSKYKVYIIDEVHMLTTFSFNALLKTLEEPPNHVIFILATTDAHKLPETIISRTQRFSFKAVSINNLIDQLSKIAKLEKINITEEALSLIAEHSQGSFRDAISMLDQMRGHKKIDPEEIYKLLGVPNAKLIDDLLGLLNKGDFSSILKYIEDLYHKGYQPSGIADALHVELRKKVIDRNQHSLAVFKLMDKLLNVAGSYNPERFLEIILLDYASSNSSKEIGESEGKTEVTMKTKTKSVETPVEQIKTKDQEQEIVYDSKLSEDIFTSLLAELKKRHNTLYGIVRMAEHEYVDDELILTFKYPFHQKRISEEANQKILKNILQKIGGQPTKISCLLKKSDEDAVQQMKNDEEEDSGIEAISNIFGGAEVLES